MLPEKNKQAQLIKSNAAAIEIEMRWLSMVIELRMDIHSKNEYPFHKIINLLTPDQTAHQSNYNLFLNEYKLNFSERIILALALAPAVMPHLLDIFFTKNATYDRSFTEFGGFKGQNHLGFIPTGETVAFILAGNDLSKRFELFDIFNADHFFFKRHVLQISTSSPDEPILSGVLSVTTEYLNYFTTGKNFKPDFTAQFPAKQIHTKMDWDNLVLDNNTMDAINEVRDWLKFGDTIMRNWGMEKSLKPGYRALFYGPPGTGKTLTVGLLGKHADMDVYRIDLSMVVSKYIGETEKNLSRIFDYAEYKNWILFFDEADALFGKRTATSNANDRFANQEVSYLLQRIEDYPGMVILATNLKANIDEAFSRRFQSMIYFPMPGVEQRTKLWEQAVSKKIKLHKDVDLSGIAEKYELAGGSIANISLFITLKASKRKDHLITRADVIDGIRKEFAKDGKTVGK